MKIYKLKYANRASGIADLISKGVIDADENNTSITHAVVEIGLIVDTPAVIVNNEIVTPATYVDGYHFDVMVTQEIDFGINRMTPATSVHSFLGFNTNQYNQTNNNTNETEIN